MSALLLGAALLTAGLIAAVVATPPAADGPPAEQGSRRPAFCGNLDCPEFEVKEHLGNGVQRRRYAPNSWAVTDVNEKSFESATIVGYQRLLRFFKGDNELQVGLDVTAPVATLVRVDKEGDFKEGFTVAFYLPQEFQLQYDKSRKQQSVPKKDAGGKEAEVEGEDRKPHYSRKSEPPIPDDSRVELVDIYEQDVWVLPFSGYALGFRVRRLVRDFTAFLRRNGVEDLDDTCFVVAVYDPPYKPFSRHNEIAMLRRSKDHKAAEGVQAAAPVQATV